MTSLHRKPTSSRSKSSLELLPGPTPGRLGHLTPEQQTALDELRNDLKKEGLYDPVQLDEHTLLRFLRARRFDLTNTKIMLHKYLKWRWVGLARRAAAIFGHDKLPIADPFSSLSPAPLAHSTTTTERTLASMNSTRLSSLSRNQRSTRYTRATTTEQTRLAGQSTLSTSGNSTSEPSLGSRPKTDS